MAKPMSHCTPAEAKAVLDSLRPRATMRELRAALVARGTPVSDKTLFNWKKSGWQSKTSSKPLQTGLLREARDAVERVGLPADVLSGFNDAALLQHDIRALLINAGLLLGMVQHDLPRLMRENPRGLAAIVTAAHKLIEGGLDLMAETRSQAERAMRERLMLLPAPYDAHHDGNRHTDRDDQRSVTDRPPIVNRADSDRPPFA